ncbi:hypothetical protein OHT57_24425 [Streptomyces sp. NBC_00285]|uniref:hypothetical protein n=1 Tax=Streptomyces sp. NBC_00285 TaxID=2975700 RepID=UPI002E2935AF|nr:hypothetical protein [Streptomyces sp. NBC_00285]
MSLLLSSLSPVETSPDSELTPLLTAWDLAHPAAADPDWRHLLDELAHPGTTQAFHSLAMSAG